MDDREKKIRERAHQLWLDAGRPDGQEVSHWEQAISEVDKEDVAENESVDPLTADAAPIKEPAAVLSSAVLGRQKKKRG